MMSRYNIKRIVIVKEAKKHPIGIMSLKDIIKFVISDKTYRNLREIPICEAMIRNLIIANKNSVCKYEKNRSQVLTQKEYEFLKDLNQGNISKYKASYQHTLKLRILKKQAAMTEACNLIKSLTDKLRSLK